MRNGKPRHFQRSGLWNLQNAHQFTSLYLVESVLNALSVEMCGLRNVLAVPALDDLEGPDLHALDECGLRKITVVLDAGGDSRGIAARTRVRLHQVGIICEFCIMPDRSRINAVLADGGPDKLEKMITAATTSDVPGSTSCEEEKPSFTPASSGDGIAVACGVYRYELMGLEKGRRKLKATVRVEHGGRLHVDTLDLYSARARRTLSQDLARIFDRGAWEIDADIARLITSCEAWRPPKDKPKAQEHKPLSAEEQVEAVAFGKASDLVERICRDFGTCGLIGEKHNRLLCYLAAVSRKMDEPISVLILSSSGAGKSTLQDVTLKFCPPEDVVKLTSLTGKALFYKDEMSLKHKILALEEGTGADEASYAIRNLISAGELVIEATIKDKVTGRLRAEANRVQGPTTVFYTVTDPEVDPETRSRFFVIGIDESREQTSQILKRQRTRHQLSGLETDAAAAAAVKRHQNFQRLLKPLKVVNPYADRLVYGDDRLQARRDQPKYLNLIRAVAFLRQMSKNIQTWKNGGGETISYVEADKEDVRIATQLAVGILGITLDELSEPSRQLLMQIDAMVTHELKRMGAETVERSAISFTRREIREKSGWSNYRVHTHLKELVDLEYVLVDSGRGGSRYRYRLAYDGQGKNGERFVIGLKQAEELLNEESSIES